MIMRVRGSPIVVSFSCLLFVEGGSEEDVVADFDVEIYRTHDKFCAISFFTTSLNVILFGYQRFSTLKTS